MEKIPLDTPNLIAIHIEAPAKPPVAAVDVKAEFTMSKKISGISEILVKIINRPPRIYIRAIVGTSLEAALPILLIPPNITNETKAAITNPIIILDIPNSIESTCATELD